MARISGSYFIGIKYNEEPGFRMLILNAQTEDKNRNKYNIEAIDAFTSGFKSKEELIEAIEKKFPKHGKPVDVGVYHKYKKIIKDEMIINDPFIHTVSTKFCEDKYVDGIHKNLNRDTKGMKKIFSDVLGMVKNPEGLQRIVENKYLEKNALHIYEKLLQYGRNLLEIEKRTYKDEYERQQIENENNRIYHTIETTLLTEYSIFREVYIALFGKGSIQLKDKIGNDPTTKKNDETDVSQQIENEELRKMYIECCGDTDELFDYIIMKYNESEAGLFLDKLSYNDQRIAFGDYNEFLSKCKMLWPDAFGTGDIRR